MNGRILAFALGLIFIFSSPVSAQVTDKVHTGRQLLLQCTVGSPFQKGACLGYIWAVAAILQPGEGNVPRACVPSRVTPVLLRDQVRRWLNRRPADLSYSASSLVESALLEIYPCPIEDEIVAEAPVSNEPKDGEQLFNSSCASCHGPNGLNNGALTPSLDPMPQPLASIAKHNSGEFPSDFLYAVLKGTDEKQAHKNRRIPPTGIPFTNEQLAALDQYVRSLQEE